VHRSKSRRSRPVRVRLGHSAMSAQCPVCPEADTAERRATPHSVPQLHAPMTIAQLLEDARAQARETRRSFQLKRTAKYRSNSICGRWTKDKAGAVVTWHIESTDRNGRGTIFSLTWGEKFDPAKDVKKDEKPQVIELPDAVGARLVGLRSMVALMGVAGPHARYPRGSQ
jgi:hypothetical protein